jgi:hypothetical protein
MLVLCLLHRFVKVLVQEFSIQLDKGFLLSVYDILSNWQVEEKPSVRIRADIALVHIPIAMIAAKVCVRLIYLHDLEFLFVLLTYCLEKYWNGDHQGEGNEADPNLPEQRGLEE